MKYLQS